MPLPLFRNRSRVPALLAGITRTLLAGVVFLVPLTFVPGLNDSLELPKTVLFLILTLAAAVTWSVGWVVNGAVTWRPVAGWQILTGFAVVLSISAAASVGHVVSLLGVPGYAHHTLPVLLGAILYIVLVSQAFERPAELAVFPWAIVGSIGIVAVVSLVQIAGASFLPWHNLQGTGFLISGTSSTSLTVLLAAAATIMVAFASYARGLLGRTILIGGGAVMAFLFLGIDSIAGWIALLVGLAITSAFASLQRLSRTQVLVTTVGIVLAIVGLLTPTAGLFGDRVPPDVKLDARTAWSVTTSTLSHEPIVGSGPSTFYHDFVRFRPASYSSSPLAQLRFVKSSDEALQLLTTLGVLGAGLLLALIVFIIIRLSVGSESIARRNGDGWGLTASLIGAWTGIVAAGFFAPSTAASATLFWVLTGVLLVTIRSSGDLVSRNRPAARLGGTLGFFLLLGGFVLTTVWSVRLILVDRGFVTVAKAISSTEDLGQVVTRLDRLTKLNASSPAPYLLRSQARVVQAQLAIQAGNQGSAESLIAAARIDAETAVSRDPNNPAVLESVADLYKAIGELTGATGDLVISAYERAVALEPTNIILQVDLGQAYYLTAAGLKAQSTDDPAQTSDIQARTMKARAAFEAAVRSVPDDLDAGFGLVLVDELAGESDRAFERLTNLAASHPQSAGLWYQLGLRYVDRKDDTQASNAFVRAIELQSTLTDAYWQIGLIAERAKDMKTARQAFETVLQIDSSRTDAQQKLDALPKE